MSKFLMAAAIIACLFAVGFPIYWYCTHECAETETYFVPASDDEVIVSTDPFVMIPNHVNAHYATRCAYWKKR